MGGLYCEIKCYYFIEIVNYMEIVRYSVILLRLVVIVFMCFIVSFIYCGFMSWFLIIIGNKSMSLFEISFKVRDLSFNIKV